MIMRNRYMSLLPVLILSLIVSTGYDYGLAWERVGMIYIPPQTLWWEGGEDWILTPPSFPVEDDDQDDQDIHSLK